MNPRELTSFFLALSLGMGESSFSRRGFQTKPRQITRIHLLQSGSGAEQKDQSWPGDSKSRPSPPPPRPDPPPTPPPTRNTPLSACTKTRAGWWLRSGWADSHFMGVVLITEVMNELRKHKQIMRDIHPAHTPRPHTAHVILCLTVSLCLCPTPAHPQPLTPNAYPHTPRAYHTHKRKKITGLYH